MRLARMLGIACVALSGPWLHASDYCRMTHEDFLQDSSDLSRFIPFVNPPAGLAHGGVCWWHSEFQRNLIYLGVLKPDAKRLSMRQEESLIRRIMRGNQVVEIPGHSSLREFLTPHQDFVIRVLERQQLIDGFVKQAWVIGLAGRPKVPARRLTKLMHRLYDHFSKKRRVTYQFLQIKGADAHAWLVTDIHPVNQGYDLSVIDSNYGAPRSVHFRYGDQNLSDGGKTTWVPYTWRERDFLKIKRAMKRYCSGEGGSTFVDEERS